MPGKKWTLEEDIFLAENYAKMSYPEIQKVLSNRTLCAIHMRVHARGLIDPEKSYLLRVAAARKYSFTEDFFDIPNLRNCYWAGFIAADGCITDNKHHPNNIEIKISSKDKEHLRQFVSDVKFTGPIFEYESHGWPMCRTTVASRQWKQSLEKNFGIGPRKTFTLRPPELISDELKDAFIAGYIDGDGCIGIQYEKYPLIGILGTQEVLEWIRDRFGIIINERIDNKIVNHVNIKQFQIVGKRTEQIIRHFQQYENIIPLLERKWFRYGVL